MADVTINRIVLKQSGETKVIRVSDNILKSGEVAYTYVNGDSSGGGRLYIGAGGNDSANGFATEIHTIGGKYYTDMMDHVRGTLTPLSAITTDSNNKISRLIVDDIDIDFRTISTTDGDLVLAPYTNEIDADNSKIKNVVDPTNAQDAATKNYVDALDLFDFTGDVLSGNGEVNPGQTVTVAGGTNINTKITEVGNGVKVDIHLDSDVLNLSRLSVDNINLNGDRLSTTSGNLTIDPASGYLYVSGNLVVNGTTTTINSTDLTINDKNIILADGATTRAEADSGGITLAGANAQIFYQNSDHKWHFNPGIVTPDLSVTGTFSAATIAGQYQGFDSDFAAKSTDDLSEGTTNLYYSSTLADSDFDIRLATKNTDDLNEGNNLFFTDLRARGTLTVTDAGGDGSLAYDPVAGEFTYTGPSASEVRAHFSAAGDLSYDSSTGEFSIDVETVYTKDNFDSDLGLANTDQLAEGSTNLYYTDTRFNTNFATKTTDNLTEGSTNLYFTGERVDDRVFALLRPGDAIDLNYDDAQDELVISAELATSINHGVASFDVTDFTVTAGNVEINTIDCGTY